MQIGTKNTFFALDAASLSRMQNRSARNFALSVIFGLTCSAGLVLAGATVRPSPASALIPAGGVLRVNVAEAVGGKTVFGQLAVAQVTGAGFVTAYGCDDGIPRDGQGNINKSDLNYDGQVTPVTSNRLIVKADNDGDICFYTLAPAEMIVDINGVTDIGVTAIANQRTDTRIASSNLLDNLTVAAQNTTVPYDRDEWQHWIDADGDCQNTRAEVLIRDSSASVTFTSSSNCTVSTGQWLDPWTSIAFSVASDVDIDHTVPLANAHRSGGWNFSAIEKRDFANDLGNNDALRAMDDSTNSSKGSRGPESWKPTSVVSWCDYATDWASIKIRWNLTVNPAEYNALAQMLDTCDGTTTTTIAPATTVPPATTPVPANPGDSKNCGDFSTYAEAKAWFDIYYPYYGDVANLDGNGDLEPCESLPGGPS